jgi:ABC-type Na+ efflux pump permease subunit
MNNRINSSPMPLERIIAALSYLTMGFVGFIWLLLGLFTKSTLRPFLQYHIFQSIFISIAYFLVSQLLGLVMNILSFIPFVNQLVLASTFYLNMPLIFGVSIIQFLIYIVLFYLMLTSLQGKFSYIPWVSDIIKTNVR